MTAINAVLQNATILTGLRTILTGLRTILTGLRTILTGLRTILTGLRMRSHYEVIKHVKHILSKHISLNIINKYIYLGTYLQLT